MADDVFAAADQGGEPESPDPSTVEALVGEGKKFKTIEDLARGKLEADNFIEKLKEENQMALDEIEKLQGNREESARLADLIAAVKDARQQGNAEDNQLSEDALSEKIRQIMKGETEAETKRRNRDEGNELVLKKVGGDVEAAKIFIAERAKELNMDSDQLAALSETSPQAFARLIDADLSTGSPSGTVKLQGSNPRAMDAHADIETIDGRHTKLYYDRLRKEMGTLAYLRDKKLQKGYLDDAMYLGDRFNPNQTSNY